MNVDLNPLGKLKKIEREKTKRGAQKKRRYNQRDWMVISWIWHFIDNFLIKCQFALPPKNFMVKQINIKPI